MHHRRSRIIFAVAVVSLPVLAPAHHGGAVEWQADLRGPVTGIATEFAYRFPHVIVYVDVETDAGVRNMAMVTRWTPTILRGLGWSRGSIQAGDRIEVTYQAHVTDPGVAHMRSIEVNGESLSLDP